MREIVMLYRDGDQVCALIGENIQEGITGFGHTTGDALRNLAKAVDREGWPQF